MNKIAYFAGGCFWGVEYYLKSVKGVISVKSGLSGGHLEAPTMDDVYHKKTGHAETVEVVYDTELIDFESLAKKFFELHDFTQVNRQGPDIGEQYRSEVFYVNEDQKLVIEKLIRELRDKDYEVATRLSQFEKFWLAEDYHQEYYLKKGSTPYCHAWRKIW